MRGITSSLWPIRTKPLPDELLSSWLLRIAYGHGLKAQTFCNLVFGGRRQVWNRDIDRLGPEWLVEEMASRTGTPIEIARATTLRAYEGWLYRKFNLSGVLPWMLVLKMNHRKWTGFGMQYCPLCLDADETPYFRKRWRVAFNVVCPKHKVRLLDRCPQCSNGVAFHRIEMGKLDSAHVESLSVCYACGFDLRYARTEKVKPVGDEAIALLFLYCEALELQASARDPTTTDGHAAVLYQICKLMRSPRKNVRLAEFAVCQLGLNGIRIDLGKTPLESRPLSERIEILTLALWMASDLGARLRAAWQDRALRYNHMLKDFNDPPSWYFDLVSQFENWRDRLVPNEPTGCKRD